MPLPAQVSKNMSMHVVLRKSAVLMIHFAMFGISMSSFCLGPLSVVAARYIMSRNRHNIPASSQVVPCTSSCRSRGRLEDVSEDHQHHDGPSTATRNGTTSNFILSNGLSSKSLTSEGISGSKCPGCTGPATALFVFGDSLSDVGNNIYGPPSFATNAFRSPNGLDYIPGSGRFSNGKLCVDFLGKHSQTI